MYEPSIEPGREKGKALAATQFLWGSSLASFLAASFPGLLASLSSSFPHFFLSLFFLWLNAKSEVYFH